MKLHNETAGIFIPDGKSVAEALTRITHLGIGAHQDDLEIMAFHGIAACYAKDDCWFGGITCTNGGGSPRAGIYADHTDAQMMAVRRSEQNAAAVAGNYGAMIQLDYPSGAVKSADDPSLKGDLKRILSGMHPRVVYTHNPADKHDTHIGVAVAALQAMRELPRFQRPPRVWGCEVWRDLDWLVDEDKVLFDCSLRENLQVALLGVFDSQISGGKRYDLATMGRRRAHATYYASHSVDVTTGTIFAMDLAPLIQDPAVSVQDYVQGFIERFAQDVAGRLCRLL